MSQDQSLETTHDTDMCEVSDASGVEFIFLDVPDHTPIELVPGASGRHGRGVAVAHQPESQGTRLSDNPFNSYLDV